MNAHPPAQTALSPGGILEAVLEGVRARGRWRSLRYRTAQQRPEEPVLPADDDSTRLIIFARAMAAFQRPYLAESYTAEPGAAVRDEDEQNPGCKKIIFQTREGAPEIYRGLTAGNYRADTPTGPDLKAASDRESTTWSGKLATYKSLKAGWDGYSASPPTAVVIAAARHFLAATAEFCPDRVAPSVVGGIGVTYRKNGRKVYVEFRNTGSILALFSDGTTEPEVEPVDPDESSAFLTRVRGYLGE